MVPRFCLKVSVSFAAAHQLRDYPGDCSRLHGHNWRLEVEVAASKLDDSGMVIDFRQIKHAAREVTDELDHTFLNETPPFDRLNPTAENIAAYLFGRLSDRINDGNRSIAAVTLWETDNASVRYSEELS